MAKKSPMDKQTVEARRLCAREECGHPISDHFWQCGPDEVLGPCRCNRVACPCTSYVPPQTKPADCPPKRGVFPVSNPSPLPADEKFVLWLDEDGDYIIQAQREADKQYLTAHGATPEDAVWRMREVLDMAASMGPPSAAPPQTAAPSLEEMKAAVLKAHPKATTFFANEGPNSHWRMRDAAMNEIDRIYCGALEGDAPIWRQVYAKLPAPDAQGGDESDEARASDAAWEADQNNEEFSYKNGFKAGVQWQAAHQMTREDATAILEDSAVLARRDRDAFDGGYAMGREDTIKAALAAVEATTQPFDTDMMYKADAMDNIRALLPPPKEGGKA